jgi:hypothetical protein
MLTLVYLLGFVSLLHVVLFLIAHGFAMHFRAEARMWKESSDAWEEDRDELAGKLAIAELNAALHPNHVERLECRIDKLKAALAAGEDAAAYRSKAIDDWHAAWCAVRAELATERAVSEELGETIDRMAVFLDERDVEIDSLVRVIHAAAATAGESALLLAEVADVFDADEDADDDEVLA